MTRVKICGLRDPQDARMARDAGADMLGVIFAESPRRASIAQARAIRAMLGPRIELFRPDTDHFGVAVDEVGRPLLVGVFARQPADEIVRITAEVDLDVIQLSGGEHPELVARLPRPVIRVHHVDAGTDPDALLRRISQGPPTVPALDTYSAQGGGSGRTFDWRIAGAIARIRPIILSGGLTPDNVAAAIERVHPWAVDVSSGVERRSAERRPAGAGRQVAPPDASLHRERARHRGGGPRADGRRAMTSDAPPAGAGRFGEFGGQYIPETLMPACAELEEAWTAAQSDEDFQKELADLLGHYAGRPTPLSDAPRLSAALGVPRIVIKREDLLHTGAHKINNAVGQVLLARKMGKQRIIAETGPGSTASRRPPPAPASAWSASSTWAPRTCGGSRSTSSACACWAPRCAPSIPARARSRTPSTRPSATG